VDLRTPLGLLFALLGLLLVGCGLIGGPAAYAASLGFNVNLWWGLAMCVFGVVMAGAAYRRKAH